MDSFVAAASVMCANLGRLEEELKALEEAGCDELHFDIGDGIFVPDFTLSADFVKMAKRCCSLPCSAHLMVAKPENHIGRFVEAGCDAVTVHVETCPHAHRTLNQIRDAGASAGVAISPGTPLTKLDYLLDCVDRVMVMTVEPGNSGQETIPSTFERVRILKEHLDYRKLNIQIEVKGNIDAHNAAVLLRHGAEIFVLDTSSIFSGGGTDYTQALTEFREAVSAEKHVV